MTGRWDNAASYDSWYLATTEIGAIAESFYSKASWRPETFLTRIGQPRVLAAFEVHDSLELVDLDDPATLTKFSMIPSQVVRQNLPVTQAAALQIFNETRTDAVPAAGLSWWSSQLPAEDVLMLWAEPEARPPMSLVEEFDLGVEMDQVKEAADRLRRLIAK